MSGDLNSGLLSPNPSLYPLYHMDSMLSMLILGNSREKLFSQLSITLALVRYWSMAFCWRLVLWKRTLELAICFHPLSHGNLRGSRDQLVGERLRFSFKHVWFLLHHFGIYSLLICNAVPKVAPQLSWRSALLTYFSHASKRTPSCSLHHIYIFALPSELAACGR